MKLGSKQALLLAIFSSSDGKERQIVGRTRLMKIMFLLEKELLPQLDKNAFDLDELPVFEAYKYGPFSQGVYSDLEFLKSVDFLIETPLLSSSETSDEERLEYLTWKGEISDVSGFGLDEDQLKSITLTADGEEYVTAVLLPEIQKSQMNHIKSFVRRLAALPLATLLKYVYQTYPEYTDNSEIRERVLR